MTNTFLEDINVLPAQFYLNNILYKYRGKKHLTNTPKKYHIWTMDDYRIYTKSPLDDIIFVFRNIDIIDITAYGTKTLYLDDRDIVEFWSLYKQLKLTNRVLEYRH